MAGDFRNLFAKQGLTENITDAKNSRLPVSLASDSW